ncbi:MAG TPA: folylpolyglutamate synthase/dihydrofolate synthase family protein [Candidatus Marinimicrobia bacterium]|nr:folylpolyglutamate synthase/dihydrofolate synthase family protein [Candidatus Neomarinimicrobiota bacterium]HRU93508.1 folylpolyglutamate synthase/dihydrofolate synthase family protein [Candidatus Neomarinimicrobiota bacterium]
MSSSDAADLRPILSYLYSLNGRGIKPGLERIQKLLDAIGNPQNAYKVIHVAGTNGKGSTCAIMANILQTAGYRVGLYTSPHLLNFNERIRINGQKIPDAEIALFTERWRKLIDELNCSFFEATTAMALDYFKKNKVDYAVLETGMGGRFDATNVTLPEVTVITPIGRDHQEFLGRRLAQIAYEKAGIVKSGIPCIVARQTPRVLNFLSKEINCRGGDFYYAPEQCQITNIQRFPERQVLSLIVNNLKIDTVKFPLIGDHQLINLQAAVSALKRVKSLEISPKVLRDGISGVVWPGRLQILSHKPLIYFDVGHNQHGIRQVVKALKQIFPTQPVHLVLALGSVKKYDRIGKIIQPLGGDIYLTEIPDHPSVSAEILADVIRKQIPSRLIYVDNKLERLLNFFESQIKPDEILLIAGSHYLAPQVLPFYGVSLT